MHQDIFFFLIPSESGLTQLSQLIGSAKVPPPVPGFALYLPDEACSTGRERVPGIAQLFPVHPDMHGEARGDFESVKS